MASILSNNLKCGDIAELQKQPIYATTYTTIAEAMDVLNKSNQQQLLVIDVEYLSRAARGYIDEDQVDGEDFHNATSYKFDSGETDLVAQEPYREFIGVLDVWDIAAYLGLFSGSKDNQQERLTKIDAISKNVDTTFVPDIVGLYFDVEKGERQIGLFIANENKPLVDILRLFCFGVKTVFIKPTTDSSKTGPTSLRTLSQLDILKFIMDSNSMDMELIKRLTLQESGVFQRSPGGFNTLCALPEDAVVVDVLQEMVKRKADAAAIVSRATGTLITTFSPSDVRTLTLGSGLKYNLQKQVGQYIRDLNQGSIPESIVLNQNSTLAAAIAKMVQNNVHRIWVVDSNMNPSACVTAEDVLSKFVP